MELLVKAREEFSKWIMRSLQAGRVLRMPLLGVTAVSTLVTALRGTMFQNYTLHIVSAFGILAVGFIWAYDRFKVLNIQQKWDQDRSSNFVGPNMAINNMISARQFSVLSKAMQEDWDEEKRREELERVTEEAIQEFRNGIDLSRLDGDH